MDGQKHSGEATDFQAFLITRPKLGHQRVHHIRDVVGIGGPRIKQAGEELLENARQQYGIGV